VVPRSGRDMRILVFAHRLEVGGTQVNAIELSAYLRDSFGHQISYFAAPGPMNELVHEKGLRYLPAPDASAHPSLIRSRALDEAIRSEQPDIVHVWDWPQYADAFIAIHRRRVPTAVTCMAMVVPAVLSKRLPTTFGTPDLVRHARALGYRDVQLLMPPVDTRSNSPDPARRRTFRAQYGIADNDILLVTVSRLVNWMKLEGLSRTLHAFRALSPDRRLRLVIAGDGEARDDLERFAAQINGEIGRTGVILTGPLLDPRGAYAAADIVIGMGGSALRGMAFAKPVIVVGQRGFAEIYTPSTAEYFHRMGIYGLGGDRIGTDRLSEQIRELLDSPPRREELGAFSRQFVARNYSMDIIGPSLNAFLSGAVERPLGLSSATADGIRTAALVLGHRLLPQGPRRWLTSIKRGLARNRAATDGVGPDARQ
jgi:L-malate glycosyltransferase